MIPYFIIFILLSILSLFDLITKNKYQKFILLQLACFLLIIFSGLRNETGTDWDNYYEFFIKVDELPVGETGFEFLYEFLIRFCREFSTNYSLVLFLTSFLILIPNSYTLFKYSPLPIFSLILLFGYSLNSSGMGYRQDIAISICSIATIFAINRKIIPFLILVILASFFHQSAIIYLFSYFIMQFKWNKTKIIITILLIIFSFEVASYIAPLFLTFYTESAAGKVENYLLMDKNEAMMGMGDYHTKLLLSAVNRVILIFPSIYINHKKNNPILSKINNLVLFGAIIYLGLFPLGVVFTRLSRYFELFFIISLPFSIVMINGNKKWLLLVIYFILSAFKLYYVLYNDLNVYVPYKSII